MSAPLYPPTATAAHAGPRATFRVLVATIAALLLLTGLTVGVAAFDFGGAANLWIALLIATAKATLVALYFMQLRYDQPFNAVVLIAALLFIVLFIALTLADSLQYRPDVQLYRAADPAHYAPALERF